MITIIITTVKAPCNTLLQGSVPDQPGVILGISDTNNGKLTYHITHDHNISHWYTQDLTTKCELNYGHWLLCFYHWS